MIVDLVISTVDKVNPDPVLDLGCVKAGHVICYEPAGHEWSEHELTSPNWRIVTVDLPMSAIDALTCPQYDNPMMKPVCWRKFKIDLSKLSPKCFDRTQKKADVASAEIISASVLIK